jgi:hypothetical protein
VPEPTTDEAQEAAATQVAADLDDLQVVAYNEAAAAAAAVYTAEAAVAAAAVALDIAKQYQASAAATSVTQTNTTLFAKVGNGKSSSGNTLLRAWGYNEDGFVSRRDINAVTQDSQTIEHELHGVRLRVTDQVGLLDSRGVAFDAEKLRDTALSKEHKDGYHVIFVLLKITDRMDAAEQIILGVIRRFYGEGVGQHVVLLLTHIDNLDTSDEIERLVAGAKSSVEEELGQSIACAIPVNNHLKKIAPNGQDIAKTGTMMLEAIRDIVAANSTPFTPLDVEVQEIKNYIAEECAKRKLSFDKIFPAFQRMNCNIL